MIRALVLVAAGLLTLIGAACTPPASPPAPGPTSGTLWHRANLCSDAASFVKSIRIMNTVYDPSSLADPPKDESAKLTPEQMADLQSAYELAPSYFRTELCQLDGVLLDRTTCVDVSSGKSQDPLPCYTYSWGFRNPETGRRFIGISASLWKNGHAPRITEYSSSRLRALLAALHAGTVKFSFDTADPQDPANSPGMAVLAALAHEMGHVRWYDWNVPLAHHMQEDPHYDFARLRQCPGRFYFNDGWGPPADPRSDNAPDEAFYAPKWLEFAATANPAIIVHRQPPQIADFQRDGSPRTPAAQRQSYRSREPGRDLAQNLAAIYSPNQVWASLLGSLHPEHDLIETYVLGVVTYNGRQDAPRGSHLTSLRLNIVSADKKTSSIDIVDDYLHARKSDLARHVECLISLSLSDAKSTPR